MSTTFEPNPYEAPLTRSELRTPSVSADGSDAFRFGFRTLWIFAMVVAVVGMGLLIGIGVLMGLPPLPRWTRSPTIDGVLHAGLAVLIAALVETAAVWLMWIGCPIYVSPLGIRCQNAFGRYRFIRWDQVTRVRTSNFLGVRSFRIYSANLKWPLWLPGYMAKPKLFWPYLLSLLEADSPLAKAIRDAELAQ